MTKAKAVEELRRPWRRCYFCKMEMDAEPVKVDGKEYSFCCIQHKQEFDEARLAIKRLQKGYAS